MYFVASTAPIEEILKICEAKADHAGKALALQSSVDYFIFLRCSNIPGQTLEDTINLLCLYPVYYSEKLYAYKISNEYYKNGLNSFYDNDCNFASFMRKIPSNPFDMEGYQRVPREQQIWDVFDYNFVEDLKKRIADMDLNESGICCLELG